MKCIYICVTLGVVQSVYISVNAFFHIRVCCGFSKEPFHTGGTLFTKHRVR